MKLFFGNFETSCRVAIQKIRTITLSLVDTPGIEPGTARKNLLHECLLSGRDNQLHHVPSFGTRGRANSNARTKTMTVAKPIRVEAGIER
jgi:hypothetical protein